MLQVRHHLDTISCVWQEEAAGVEKSVPVGPTSETNGAAPPETTAAPPTGGALLIPVYQDFFQESAVLSFINNANASVCVAQELLQLSHL